MDTNLKQLISNEFTKCAKSPAYFLKKYCYIQHPIKGKLLFDLYPFQENSIKEFEDNDYNIVLKGRQLGFSTLVAGYALWLMIFHRDKSILVIATKQETAKNLVTKVQYMHKMLPIWLRGKLITENKLSLQFSNGSQIKAIARSKDAGRSEALSLLILDECAFIDNADTIWTAASSTLSTGGKAILISTPNGVGNFFHKMWLQSEEGISNFNPILLDWKVHPDRDQAWRDRQTEILGEAEAAQEHDASFIFSGNTVVKPEILEFYKKTYVTEPIKKEGFDGNLWIWEYPKENKTYILAGDVARGDGDDFSAFHIIDAESSVQVAEYKGKIPPKEFGNLMVATATMYNDALLIADNSTIGFASLQQVIDRQYKNLFYMSKDLQVVDVLTSNYRYNKRDMVPGFTISSRTRPLIIAKLDEYMRQNSIILRSTRMLSELETFIWKNGRAEALSNYHDDLTMALAIGLWVRDTALRIHQDQLELTKQGLNATHVQYTPFVVNSGVQHNPYQMQVGQSIEDIRWLLG
jgi:hypothetical protein